jgi:hypothetical protein
VPDVEQRRWRMLCQAMPRIVEERTRGRNQIELLGVSGWRILKALV